MKFSALRHVVPFVAFTLMLILSAPRAQAAFVLIDDFSVGITGTPLSAYNPSWSASTHYTIQTDPTNASNLVASLASNAGNNTAATRSFGAANNIADGTTGTIFFRAMYPSGVSGNFGIYMQDTIVNGQTGNRRAGVVFAGSTLTEVGSSSGPVTTAGWSSPAKDSWYRFWVVMDNLNDQFELYAQDEVGGLQTLLGIGAGTLLNFQNGPTSNPIQAIMLLTSNNSVPTGGFFDDLYVDNTGRNLSNPLAAVQAAIPEPASISLLALCGLAMLARRGNR